MIRTVGSHREGVGAVSASGPVLLVTLGVALDTRATAVAIDAAVESGKPLVISNITQLEPLTLSVMMGYDALEELTPDVSRSVRQPAEIAAAFGLDVELLRVRSPRPISALLELIRERRPSLVVFGPDPAKIALRRARRAVAALQDGVGSSLFWLSDGLGSRGSSAVVSPPGRRWRPSRGAGGAG